MSWKRTFWVEILGDLETSWTWMSKSLPRFGRSSATISEKAMATHSSALAWKIPWTEESGRLQSMGSWRVGHDWATFTFMSNWGLIPTIQTSQVVLVIKKLPANAGDVKDAGLIPGSGRSPEGGHGNPLHYACLENPMDRGASKATVHRVTQSWTRLKQFSMHACIHNLWSLIAQ